MAPFLTGLRIRIFFCCSSKQSRNCLALPPRNYETNRRAKGF